MFSQKNTLGVNKNTIRVDTIDTVDMVYTVDTGDEGDHYGKDRLRLETSFGK